MTLPPASRAASSRAGPAQTRLSLLARGDDRARAGGRQGRREPRGPDDRRHDPVGAHGGGFLDRPGSAGAGDAAAGQALTQLSQRDSCSMTATRGRQRRACSASFSTLRPAVRAGSTSARTWSYRRTGRGSKRRSSRSSPERRRCGRRSSRPAPSDRSARAPAMTTEANIRPSTRSSRPPCPGIRSPGSLTPNRRFKAVSHRSPAMVASPPARPMRPPRTRPPSHRKTSTRTARDHRPDQPAEEAGRVLLGENRGQSLGPFNALPTERRRCPPTVTANSMVAQLGRAPHRAATLAMAQGAM